MVFGVAIGSLISGFLGIYLVCSDKTPGDRLFTVPLSAWPYLVADTIGIGCYGILSALATQYLPGAEVAFLLLIDVVVAPLLVCVVHGEVPTSMASAGAFLLTCAVFGHEFAALRESSDSAKIAAAGGLGVAHRAVPTAVGI